MNLYNKGKKQNKEASALKHTWKYHTNTVPPGLSDLNDQLRSMNKKEFHPLIIQHLSNLGLNDSDQAIRFLYPQMQHCHSHWLMKDMKKTVDALLLAISEGKQITVVADYDVDGVVSGSIAYQGLKRLGANVDYYIPHRKHEGYGIKASVVEKLHAQGTELIVTVDNGISANGAIDVANQLGIPVYITDHHLPKTNELNEELLPNAHAIINPHQHACAYPFKEICGGVVAFKLIQALYETVGVPADQAWIEFGERLALCTVADMMPLRDENRFYVMNGVQQMRKNPSHAIQAMCKALKQDHKTLTEESIGFYLGPCINAAGRMDSALPALKLLLSDNAFDAIFSANELVIYNESRKACLEEAKKQVLLDPTHHVHVVKINTEEGIVGIVAGHIKEETMRPAFCLTDAHLPDGTLIYKGSARSVEGFSLEHVLKEAYSKHQEWFVSWGGHSGAAGVAIYTPYLDDFRNFLQDYYVHANVPTPVQLYLGKLNEKYFHMISLQLESLAPFGMSNAKPVLKTSTEIEVVKLFGPKQNHVQLISKDGVIYKQFFGADKGYLVGVLDLYVTLGRSNFMGKEQLDVMILDA